ncbi:MAG TPA: DUF72 domain-containing protein [Thermoanaerobaculia bacterium]|nr:DUF72 domain-containing protein [Thermoanaerobaculia bacterium]
MDVKVGLCGFTIGASAYFETFRVVEVQQTFYDPPAPLTLERWRAQAPPAFEFTMKAWQVITHAGTSRTYRRLKSPFTEKQRAEAGGFRLNATVMAAWQTTLACARRLRATAILFQCPASFRPTDENTAAMRRFFAEIDRPGSIRLLWEPRGPWPDDLVSDLCRDLGLVHAVDPFLRPSLTPELVYWRLHGNGSHYASYSDDDLARLRQWLAAGSEAYVMFNNIPRPGDAKRFLSLLQPQAGLATLG